MLRHRRSMWLSIPLTLLALSAARGEPLAEVEEAPDEVRPLFAKELTRTRGARPAEDVSESEDWRRIRLRKGAGLEVRREVTVGDRELVFGVKGPLMKKKRFGLAFELRF